MGSRVQPKEDAGAETLFSRSNSEKSNSPKSTTRHLTDVLFLVIMVVFFMILNGFFVYCVLYGDIFRILNGYDNCGNVCGKLTSKSQINITNLNCSQSNEDKPFLLSRKHENRKMKDRFCVKNCTDYDGYHKLLSRCIRNATHKFVDQILSKSGISNFFQEITEDFHLCYKEIIYLCLIALTLSLLLLVAFRYLVGYVVWFILSAVIVGCTVVSTWLWILWKESSDVHEETKVESLPVVELRKRHTYLAFAVISTVISIVVILVIVGLRKKIKIVVQLFRESGKALAAMPLLIFLPILTFFSLALMVCLWFYFGLWIESSGRLEEKAQGIYHYEKDAWMGMTRWYNVLVMLWRTQFIIGCQHMIIAGAVSCWYFSRDKSLLDRPIRRSFHNVFRYHLGSVAFGSLIIALVQMVRIALKFLESRLRSSNASCARCALKCCHCCVYCFENLLRYITRNAYIEVAMHGYSFCKGGRQAFRLLVANALTVTAINSVGDFTLFLGKVIVVIATVFAGIKMLENKEGVQHIWVPVTLVGLFAYFVAHCFMAVYEMIIDTIFLCFCEDCEMNDGINRPYYMSRGLMNFLENSKKVIEHHENRKYRTNTESDSNKGG